MEFFACVNWFGQFGQEKKTTMVRLSSRTIRAAGKEVLRKIIALPQVVQNEIVSVSLYVGDELLGNFVPETYNIEDETDELEWRFHF